MMMLRRCMTAVAAVLALAPAISAEAGPEKSPLAGSYVGGVPDVDGGFAITISDSGHISGSLVSGYATKGSITGRVSADGSCSFVVSVTVPVLDPGEGFTHGNRKWVTLHYRFDGNMAPDAGGNIVGTTDAGGSFAWLRQ